MSSARRSLRAVTLLFVSGFFSASAFPQAARFIRGAADPVPVVKSSATHLPASPNLCGKPAGIAGQPANNEERWREEMVPACDSPEANAPPVNVPTVNPCAAAGAIRTGCSAPARDLVQEELLTMGKPGKKILRARDRVLEILQSENACSAWYRSKEPSAAAVFRTLSYVLDGNGDEFVQETRDSGDMNIFRNPYVAKVFQNDGAYAKVTLNTKGAFFSPLARVVEAPKDGGPLSFRGARPVNVGPYFGDTLQAQVLALLHEFGHVLNLLPSDEGNHDGTSMHNTNEVLGYCRAEIESSAPRTTMAARR